MRVHTQGQNYSRAEGGHPPPPPKKILVHILVKGILILALKFIYLAPSPKTLQIDPRNPTNR